MTSSDFPDRSPKTEEQRIGGAGCRTGQGQVVDGGIQPAIPGEALQLPYPVDINIRANHLFERNIWKELLSPFT